MPNAGAGNATGFQIAFLIFAVLLLAAPLDKYVFQQWPWIRESDFPVGRVAIFLFAGLVLLAVGGLRGRCRELLAAPIPADKGKEVLAVIVLDYVAALGAIGAFALFWWSLGGEPALARRMGEGATAAEQWRRAFSASGIVLFFVVGGLLGPIVEEIIFRGMLYPAWKAQWGWIASAFATSLAFALFHPRGSGISQFLASILFICLLRRTGSLRAAIVAHSVFNISLWYPFLGRFLFPPGRETGELSVWTLHLVCLAVTCIAIPLYIWMSRDRP